MPETITEAFCWVKAVLQTPPSMGHAPIDALQPIDHPLLQGLALRKEGRALGALPAPPAPAAYAALGRIVPMGGKVPPPSPSDIPKFPPPPPAGSSGAQSLPAPTALIPGYWQKVSFAPGPERAIGQPVVVLVFQAVLGPREQAVLWRQANPGWFADAAAATLLNHGL